MYGCCGVLLRVTRRGDITATECLTIKGIEGVFFFMFFFFVCCCVCLVVAFVFGVDFFVFVSLFVMFGGAHEGIFQVETLVYEISR